uniref:Phospholipase B-like n=1 Tax=Sinocyclocheilus anshuiensis TaxID=1608454 RepID=A0A671R185_9TELE
MPTRVIITTLFCCCVFMLMWCVFNPELLKATAYWDSTHKAVLLKEGVLDRQGDAYGYYNDTLSSTGWGVLEISAGYGQTAEPDHVTMFTAGYLEGFLTAPNFPQFDYVLKWRKPLSQFAVQFLNAVGDLLDLIPALVTSGKPGFSQYKAPPMGHCSALIKMLPGFENLMFAHSSWYTYAATMRIYKHWDFRLNEPHTATGKLSFSSYPGFLVSLDDFYLLGSGLMMTQTTNNVFNTSLYSYITPASLFSWQRVRLAHALASTGEQWAKTFSRYNSGTYNNQYMVVDVSKVNLGSSLEDGALTVVEQIPGLVEYSDQTQTLRRGYWPSYNVPFHRKIYDLSGYEQMWKEHGEDFSYDLCPRAKIFRRDQSSVRDLNSLKHIMRYNDYKSDPYSQGDPCKSICCRNDLWEHQASPGGCYDTKVTDLHMAQEFVAEAVNGPTTDGGLPVFSWGPFNSTSHQGLPPKYNFSFVQMQPQLFHP